MPRDPENRYVNPSSEFIRGRNDSKPERGKAVTESEYLAQKGLNSRAIIDACRPYEWRDEFPDVVDVEGKLKRAVKERWGAFGIRGCDGP